MRRNRLLTLLALLITAATGAWAGWTGGTYTATTNEDLGAITVNGDATLTINSDVTVTVTGGINVASGTLTVTGPGTLVVTGGNGGNGSYGEIDGGNGGNGGVAISGNIIVQGGAVVTATGGNGGNGGTGDCGKGGRGGNGGNAFAGTLTYKSGTVTANGGSGGSGGWSYFDNEYASSGSAGKAFADANSVSFQTDYILTSNGSAIQTIGGQQQITIAPPPVAVTGVTLPATATVTLGDAVALTATVAPADATDKKVKWTVTAGTDKVKLYKDAECKTEVGTDATDVLTVYVKGLAVGEATVKVESNEDETKTATCAVTAKHGTYAVAMKAGVTDGDQWTARAGGSGDFAAMPLKGVEGGTKPVELKYGGDLEVKRVTMRVVPTWKGDLSKISVTELESDGVTVLVKDGMTLTGTLSENYKITIADGATVTLDGVTINGGDNPYDDNCNWAGITCLGTATIVLKDGTENTVNGFFREYPGIYVPAGSTLTIQGGTEGTGKLTASSSGLGAGIGGAVGIPCGNISITGGTVTATGGSGSPGIGGGYNASCGNITITDGVTKVTATKGDSDAPYSIGASNGGTCGTVTIGGTVYWQNGQAVDEAAGTYLAQDEIEYPTPVAFAANEYNEASWDGSKVVFTKKTAASTPTAVANSNTAVTWSDGWYTVAGEVTISGNVVLGADTYLILQDGATLTINGQLNAKDNQKNLYIYGQRKGDGKLNVITSSINQAIYGEINKTVEIHGGEITAEGRDRGLIAGYIKVFSGKITATCGSGGDDGIVFMNSCDVYGGEIEGTTNTFDDISRGISDGGNGGTFTVYGGKVKGTGSGFEDDPDYGSGFSGKVKSGTSGIKFYFSDNGTDWDEGTYYETATAAPQKKYAKAE